MGYGNRRRGSEGAFLSIGGSRTLFTTFSFMFLLPSPPTVVVARFGPNVYKRYCSSSILVLVLLL